MYWFLGVPARSCTQSKCTVFSCTRSWVQAKECTGGWCTVSSLLLSRGYNIQVGLGLGSYNGFYFVEVCPQQVVMGLGLQLRVARGRGVKFRAVLGREAKSEGL